VTHADIASQVPEPSACTMLGSEECATVAQRIGLFVVGHSMHLTPARTCEASGRCTLLANSGDSTDGIGNFQSKARSSILR
jgi:hypothetical protein